MMFAESDRVVLFPDGDPIALLVAVVLLGVPAAVVLLAVIAFRSNARKD